MLLKEALLQRVQLTVLLQAFDRFDLAAVGLAGQQRAGFDRLAVEQDSAGATVRRIAADMGAREIQVLSDEVDQEQSGLDFGAMLLAVYPHRYFDGRQRFDAHATPPCARASARR